MHLIHFKNRERGATIKYLWAKPRKYVSTKTSNFARSFGTKNKKKRGRASRNTTRQNHIKINIHEKNLCNRINIFARLVRM